MSLRGITFHIEQTPQEVTKSDDNLLSLKTNKGTISGFSHVMFATGRKPNTKVNTISHFISLVFIISHIFLCMHLDTTPAEFGTGGSWGQNG
jgi:hypothetical protein